VAIYRKAAIVAKFAFFTTITPTADVAVFQTFRVPTIAAKGAIAAKITMQNFITLLTICVYFFKITSHEDSFSPNGQNINHL
jgi:hypothetical protein